MATIVGLPKLSPTMEEGVLAKWTKKEGDKVSPGDIIAEVETDKATMDFTLEDEGTLLKQLVKEGDTVKLGAPVAILGSPGEDISGLERAQARPQAQAQAQAQAQPQPQPQAQPQAQVAAAGNGAEVVLASPIAKTLAAQHGIDLRAVKGTGPGGRIVERDIQALLAKPAPAPVVKAPPPQPTAAIVPAGEDEFTDRSLTPMRKTIARRMTEAKQTIPHFYLTAECDAAPLMAFRAAMNRIAGEDHRVSVNDLIIKACATALRRVPQANASFLGDRIRFHGRVHISVAVAVEDGLVTPVVRDADKKGLAQIHAEMLDLAERARARRLRPEEMTGGTFSVSNLGMFGIDHFEAVINPPEGAILAIGRVKKAPIVTDHGVGVGERMGLTLSCDHRVVDGALGARLMAEIVAILEHPASLAL